VIQAIKVTVRRWTGPKFRGLTGWVLFHGRGGQERGELVGVGDGESGQGLFQPGPGVHAELPTSLRKARQDRQTPTSIVTPEKKPVLP